LGDFGEKGVHRGIVTVAFENHCERTGSTGGGFFKEVEDGIGIVVEVIKSTGWRFSSGSLVKPSLNRSTRPLGRQNWIRIDDLPNILVKTLAKTINA